MSIKKSPHYIVGESGEAKMESLAGKGSGHLRSSARPGCFVSNTEIPSLCYDWGS